MADRVEQFKKIANDISELYEAKDRCYNNSFGETYEKLGIISAVTRISDKYNRLCNLAVNKDIDNLGESLELPHGYAATIQPRSGFSSKGIEVTKLFVDGGCAAEVESGVRVNGDVIRGLIDEDYRGNVGVIVRANITPRPYEVMMIKKGTRIAQMQIVSVPQIDLTEVEELSETDRGEGGFGSTGVL